MQLRKRYYFTSATQRHNYGAHLTCCGVVACALAGSLFGVLISLYLNSSTSFSTLSNLMTTPFPVPFLPFTSTMRSCRFVTSLPLQDRTRSPCRTPLEELNEYGATRVTLR